MGSAIDNIKSELQKSRHIDFNGLYSDWEMIGKWMEDNESGWPDEIGSNLTWDYIESTIAVHLEGCERLELLALMREVYCDYKFTGRFTQSIADEDDIDFIDLSLLIDYISDTIKAMAGADYIRLQREDFNIDIEDKRLFYNPIWMPEYEDIQIFGCYTPLDAQITDTNTLLHHLRARYISIASEAYRKDRGYVLDNIRKFIDEECPDVNSESLVDYLLQSSKFNKHLVPLERRIEENQLPQHIIGSDEIELETDFVELLALIAESNAL